MLILHMPQLFCFKAICVLWLWDYIKCGLNIAKVEGGFTFKVSKTKGTPNPIVLRTCRDQIWTQ